MTKFISSIMIVILVITDQVLKLIINSNIPSGQSIPIIDGVFLISNVKNTGAAFSFFGKQTWLLVYLTAAALLAMILLVAFNKIKTKFLVYSFSLVIAGGLGNLIDRIFVGEVTDFIDVKIINFAIFNFADCCVVIGCILIIYYVLFLEKKNTTELKGADDVAENG